MFENACFVLKKPKNSDFAENVRQCLFKPKMVGSANINQKWSMCQVSPENRRKRRSWTKMSKVPLMAVHSRKYSKILVLPENGRKCQF